MQNTRERDTSAPRSRLYRRGDRGPGCNLPQVERCRSNYYRTTAQWADVAVSLQVLREDHQLQELVPAKALVTAAPVKDAKLDVALAKECQATLSYAEHTRCPGRQ
jgi:hypothetical protein